MLGLGPIGFAAPWVLAGLVVLPVIWWLLRVTPPAPRRQPFPPLRLLIGLGGREESTARTPWWLLLLRLLAALLLLLGLARPILNPDHGVAASDRPLLLVVDDGWAGAAAWEARHAAALALVDQAARAGRPVQVLTTTADAEGRPPRPAPLATAEQARQILLPLVPKPWPADLEATLRALDDAGAAEAAEAVWLTSPVARPGTTALAEALQRRGGLTVLTPPAAAAPLVLLPPRRTADGLAITLRRPRPASQADALSLPPRRVTVRALDANDRPVGAVAVDMPAEASEVDAVIPLPADLRDALGRVEAVPTGGGSAGAAAVVLLADQWRRRPVGIVSTSEAGAIPLLSEAYYLDKALAETAEVKVGALEDLLDQRLAILFAPDGSLPHPVPRRLVEWVEGGGILVRFAGERLAAGQTGTRPADALLPVAIRGGGRTLGGILSWSEPAGLAPFPEGSPFAGLTVPEDVRIRAQVLAEPSADLGRRTWARLEDGTPLVTGAPRGGGWTVLVHTTANAAWTDLPLSGLFPRLLHRLIGLGQGGDGGATGAEAAGRPLPPRETLDGFGRLGPPPPAARPLPAGALDEGRATALIGPAHPPGLYGRDGQRGALNLSDHPGVSRPEALGPLPSGVGVRPLDGEVAAVDLRAWLLTASFALLLLDTVASFLLRGLLSLPRRAGRAGTAGAAGLLLFALAAPGTARAQGAEADERALEAALNTRLAYVETGVPDVDGLSRSGLRALTDVLARRSAAELALPMALDVARDELLFYPLIYWPAAAGQALPGPETKAKVAHYLDNGGLILFDGRGPDGAEPLRDLLRALDIPPLNPLPDDHVLTRSFYLLDGLPGRLAGGEVWIASAATDMEAVSPVIIGSNDWAAAWARDSQDRPLLPVVTGGEMGRELAYRAGVNMVMYALTGNYKADQVHLPAILERLTQ